MQPRQNDAVDQFVAREANGYRAEGFSRQRVSSFISMNHREEASLSGTAPEFFLSMNHSEEASLSGTAPVPEGHSG